MLKSKNIGLCFCSYYDKEAQKLAEYEPLYENGVIVEKLALFPHWRIRGIKAALDLGTITEIILMGPQNETDAYRKELIQRGVPEKLITGLVTGNSTRDAALTIQLALQEKTFHANNWTVISSDYHIRRVHLTARILHNFIIPEIIAAEHCLLQQAYAEGGETAQMKLIAEMCQNRNAAEEQLRRMYEEKGCAQLLHDPTSYVPKKKVE